MRRCGEVVGGMLGALLLVATPGLAQDAGETTSPAGSPTPLGRILWTSREAGEFALRSHFFLPLGLDRSRLPELPADGVVRVDPAGRMAAVGDELRAKGVVDPSAPMAELRMAHPSLDSTGLRPVWVEGRTWGPRAAGGDATDHPVDLGTMALGVAGGAEPLTRPAEAGAAFDAFPAGADEDGQIYFSRFFYRGQPGAQPGWYLFVRLPTGEAKPVADADGAPVPGSDAQLSPDGAFLLFVRPDPENVGSDLWVLPLAPRGHAALLVEGEGPGPRPQLGQAAAEWMDWAKRRGKARISHPGLSGDGSTLVFASDLGGDFDVWVAPLAYPGPGRVELAAEPVAVPGSEGGERASDSGPSASGDGSWIACMSDRADPAGTATRPGTRIWVVRSPLAPAAPGPAWLEVPGQPDTAEGLWPRWDQDDDPPHLQVELRPQDGSEPLLVRLTDQEPDRRPGVEVMELSLLAASWHPDAPAPGQPARPDLPPVAVGLGSGVPPLPLSFARTAGGGGGVGLLLAGALDQAAAIAAARPEGVGGGTPTPGQAFPLAPLGRLLEHPVLSRPDFAPLQTFEDVRIDLRIRARDDRWLRVPPAPGSPVAQLPAPVEARSFPDDDRRALADPPQAPWFPTRSREDLEAGLPGVGWWVEERLGPGPVVVSNEGSRELVFRSPEPAPEGPIGIPPRLLRVRAQDLLGNRTEVAIPIRVRPKGFGIRTLESSGRRAE